MKTRSYKSPDTPPIRRSARIAAAKKASMKPIRIRHNHHDTRQQARLSASGEGIPINCIVKSHTARTEYKHVQSADVNATDGSPAESATQTKPGFTVDENGLTWRIPMETPPDIPCPLCGELILWYQTEEDCYDCRRNYDQMIDELNM